VLFGRLEFIIKIDALKKSIIFLILQVIEELSVLV